jgi:CheY-like chemotaxis protein
MPDPAPVLVVDDDDDVRETLGMLLELEGFAVRSAANGREALPWLLGPPGAERPRAVLLDLRMPVMTGWDVIEALRGEGRLGEVPIVLCTSSPEDAPEGFPIVPKPVDLDELLATLRRTLG